MTAKGKKKIDIFNADLPLVHWLAAIDKNVESHEEIIAEIEQITDILESGEQTLDQVLSLFKRGQTLLGHCLALLDQAEMSVNQILGEDLTDFSLDDT